MTPLICTAYIGKLMKTIFLYKTLIIWNVAIVNFVLKKQCDCYNPSTQ